MLHRSDDERTAAATAFARAAIDRDARLMYIAAGALAERTLDAFAGAGIDVAARIASGQLAIRDASGTYLTAGAFDAEATFAMLRRECESAARDGWSGLRVAGEMGWARGRVDTVLAYERLVDDLFRAGDAAGLACPPSSSASTSGYAHATLSNADSLVASLGAETARRPHLRLDLRDLRFVDGRALHAVAADHAETGGRTTVAGAPGVTRAAMEALGLADAPWLEWAAA